MGTIGDVVVDNRDQYTYGEKLYYWEKRWSVPIRIEIGPKEVKGGFVTIAVRKSLGIGKVEVGKNLAEVIVELAKRAVEILKERIWKDVERRLEISSGELLGTISGGNIEIDQLTGKKLYGRKF